MNTIKKTGHIILSALLLFSINIAEGQPTAFNNVTVIDVREGVAKPAMTVVINGERITAVGDVITTEIPADAILIDASGKYLIPGLIDAHVHLTKNPQPENRLLGLLNYGITTVRDMGGDARTLAVLARDARMGVIPSPNIYYSAVLFGPSFLEDPRVRYSAIDRNISNGEAPWVRVVTDSTDLKQIIAEAKGTGAKGVKLYSAIEPDLLKRITVEAHRQDLKVWSHATIFSSKPSDAVTAGVDVISHSGDLYPEAHANLPSGFNEAITEWMPKQEFSLTDYDPEDSSYNSLYFLMVKNETILEPTLFVGKRPRNTGQGGQSNHLSEAVSRIDMEARREWLIRATLAAHKAGVMIAAGTDSDGSVPVQSEIEMLVECGLSPMEAIKAATLINARAIGIDKNKGTVEIGKQADLVLLDDNPLEDITNTQKIHAVVINGRYFDRQALDELLADVEKAGKD